MDRLLRERLLSLYQQLQAHDSQQPNRLDRWRNLEPESALLLSILVRSKHVKRALEIGTSNGYSTLWLADALETTGGHLISIDIDPDRTARAQQHLRDFSLAHRVECLTIDAGLFLATDQSSYDLLFLDAERRFYPAYWPALEKRLVSHPGCLLVVDNVLSHQDEVADFTALIALNDAVVGTTVAVGAGLLLVTRA